LPQEGNFPHAEIANRAIHASLYLPNNETGYYRGARFDWSGVIASLKFDGHEYFGKWFEHYDPTNHDCITGPVEEFRGDDGALGYAEAKPGGLFVKIGVGLLEKPDTRPYTFSRRYRIVQTGKRIVRPEPDRVTFVQELTDGAGYSYIYTKIVRVVSNKPELIIEHRLRNTGQRVIDTSVYNHDFYMLDHRPSGPEFRVQFPFDLHTTDDLKGLVQLRGKELIYTRPLESGDAPFANITGFGNNVADNDIRVEDRKTGAGVRERGSRPLSKVNFWSIRTTVCPEAYIHMRIEPKREFRWSIRYDFYTIPTADK
jgi:hypothetical protein